MNEARNAEAGKPRLEPCPMRRDCSIGRVRRREALLEDRAGRRRRYLKGCGCDAERRLTS